MNASALATPFFTLAAENELFANKPRIPIGEWFADIIQWMRTNLSVLFDFFTLVIQTAFDWLVIALTVAPPLVMIVVLAALAWWLADWKIALFTLLGFAVIDSIELWTATMQTLALVLVSSIIAVLLAVPIGIWGARSNAASSVIRPVLDFMQTMPAFVYLLVSIAFFSIGAVPGAIATVVFAMPPGVRLTELGIRQVDKEMVEAGEAFGAPSRQILTRIQFPLALPTIMAGINQVIMLSLSMVVIAGLAGVPGLGREVVTGITRLQYDTGFEGGLGIVILAIFLDRVTSALSQRSPVHRAERQAAS